MSTLLDDIYSYSKDSITSGLGKGVGLDQKLFPDEVKQSPFGKTLDDYVDEKKDSVINSVDPTDIHDEVFEKSLKKEIDVNQLYFKDNKISSDFIVKAQEEYGKQQQGLPFDQNAITRYRNEFNTYLPTNPDLEEGIINTGAFPINAATGKVITPDNLNEFQVNELQDKSDSGLRFMKWDRGQQLKGDNYGGPKTPEALEALSLAFSPKLAGNLARRVYEAFGGTNEVFRFYLPTIVQGLFNSRLGFDGDILPENIDKELNDFRNTGMQKYIPDADRHRIVNDIIRQQLKKTMSPEEFRAKGYDKLIEVDIDGEKVKVPEVNFVSPEYANQVFEFAFDEMSLINQIISIVGENTIGLGVFRLPYKGIAAGVNYLRKGYHSISGSKTPFSLLSPDQQLLQAKRISLSMNIPIQESAKYLALAGKKKNFFNNFFANRIAKVVGRKDVRMNFSEDMNKLQTSVTNKRNEIDQAYLSNKPQKDIDILSKELGDLEAELNYRKVKNISANLIDMGINPKGELSLALVQVAGRTLSDSPVGEAYGVAGYLLFGGVKNLYGKTSTLVGGTAIPGTSKHFPYFPSGVPFLSNFANRMALNIKLKTEDFVDGALKLLNVGGTAKGLLARPNLRKLTALAKERGLPKNFVIAVEDFVNNANKLEPEQYDAFIGDFAQGIDDINVITKDLPIQIKDEVKNMLTGSLAELTGLNVFAGVGAALDSKSGKLSAGQIRRMGKTFKNMIRHQVEFDKRITMLSNMSENLNGMILRIERGEFGTVNREVINRLRMASDLYNTATNKGREQLKILIDSDANQAKNILEQIQNPSNGLLKLYTSGSADNALSNLIHLARKTANEKGDLTEGTTSADIDVVVYNPDGTVKTASRGKVVDNEINQDVESPAQKNLFDVETTLIGGEFEGSTIEGLIVSNQKTSEMLNLTQNNKTYIDNAHSDIVSLTKIIKSSSNARVLSAYKQISTDQKIPFQNSANSIVELINANKLETQSLASAIIPTKNNVLGGTAGIKIINNLEGGAKRGMIAFFDNQEFLDEINRVGFLAEGGKFTSGEDFFLALKNHIENNPTRFNIDIDPDEGLTALQIAMVALDPSNKLPFEPQDFKFLASPIELENIRQGMIKLSKSNNPDKQKLASVILNQLDIDFNRYANTIDVADVNNIALARYTHRLEAQRFDKNTVGAEIDKFVYEGEYKFLSPEGDPITSKNLSDIFKPLINEILNPSVNFNGTVENQFKRLIATFAPTSSSLPQNIMKKDATGKFILPDADDIAKFAQPVFDLNTKEGRAGFRALRGTLSSLLKATLVSSGRYKRNIKVINDIQLGKEPKIALNPYDSFKALELPPTIKNSVEYIDKLEDIFKVQVIKRGSDQPISVNSVKIDEVFDIENQVTDTLMSSVKFQQEHQKFFKSLQNIQKQQQLDLDTIREQGGEFFQRTKLYKDNITGDTFFNRIINSGDPQQLNNYIADLDNLVATGDLTLDQKDEILKAMFVSTINTAGGLGQSSAKVKMLNGTTQNVTAFATPEIPYQLLTGSNASLSVASDNLRILARNAGIDDDQLDTMEAIFRHGIRIDPRSLVQKARGSDVTTAGTEAGFSLTNTLSKGFNLARGLISKEYVAADYAVRYAALANNAVLGAIINDNKAANIIYNMFTDPTRVLEGDANYVANVFKKFIATDLQKLKVTHENAYDQKSYWASKGVVWDEGDR